MSGERRQSLAMRALSSAALVALLLVAGCTGGGRTARHAATLAAPGTSAADSSSVLRPVTAAELAAILSRPAARGTLVNVWASWCVPCRQEFPDLLAVADSLAADGLSLVLVSTDFPAQLGDARRFLAEHDVDRPTYLKTGSDQAFIDGLDPRWTGALPATFAFDAKGRRVATHEGRASRADLEALARAALASR